MHGHKNRAGLLVLLSVIAAVGLFTRGPIPQDLAYHQFADTKEIAGVPNFWNVVSNLPFLVVGLLGLSRYRALVHNESKSGYLFLCAGVFLVGLGSGYYHHAPSNATLLWDRLPMTVAFMALFSMLLGERVIARYRGACLGLLVLLGISAALYWSWSESLGRGDLRPYALVQFLPILLMPLILLLFPARYFNGRLLFLAFGLYFLAKALEHFDRQIWNLSGFIGGHPIKHVAAAAAVFCIIYAVPARPSRRDGPASRG